MICAISGKVPEEPVVSKKSGLLFERRLIEHHIASRGKCPFTKEELTMDDLVAVKINKVVKPRPLQAASIPGLLGMFHTEWDAWMLSNFALEQQLHTARQELSHALYQDVIATGGIDSTGILFNWTSGQISSTLTGHSKKVTTIKFVPGDELVITGSGDKTVRIWKGSEDGKYDCRRVLRDHTAEVQAVAVHAMNKYFVTVSIDNTWCFYDLSTGSCLTQVGEAMPEEGYTSASFHPDGLILGIGTTVVKIWDVKSQSNVANFDGHIGSVAAVSLSENGYFLATAATDGVKLWDLRKLKNFRSFSPYDSNTQTNSGKITSLKFGADAKYMAVGSMDRNLRIFGLPWDGSDQKSPDH